MNDTPLDYLAVAQASGPEAMDFLQAQLSADLTALRENQAGLACYCSAKGRVIAVTLVIRRPDRFLLLMNRSLIHPVLERLHRYVLRARVELSRTSLVVNGREEPLGEAKEATVVCGGRKLTYVLSEQEPDEPADPQARTGLWHALELQSGLVWLGPETSEQYLPQMLGLDRIGAVSFRKGCFPGQEIIARTRYLGQVKRIPLLVEIAGDFVLAPGSSVELMDRQGETAPANLVDHAQANEQKCIVFLVSPAGPEFDPVEIRLEERAVQARRLDQA